MIFLIDDKTEVTTLSGKIIKSAAGVQTKFLHGYYTHLVKKEETRSDGKVQIYWVKPPEGKKPKLSRVLHTDLGVEDEHLEDIHKKHGLRTDDMVHYHWGDKVLITGDKDPELDGREGIVRMNLTDKPTTPQVTVAVQVGTKKDGTPRYNAATVNVNHLTLIHRANEDTLKAIGAKTVKVRTRTGGIAYVPPEQADRYSDPEKMTKKGGETAGRKHDRNSKAIVVGSMYTTKDGKYLKLEKLVKFPRNDDGSYPPAKLVFAVTNAESGEPLRRVMDEPRFQVYLNKGAVTRDTPESKTDAAKKPLTVRLESGEFFRDGTLSYDEFGEPVVAPGKEKLFGDILGENWADVETTVRSQCSRFPMVDAADADEMSNWIFEDLLKRVQKYEPYAGNPIGGVPKFLRQQAYYYSLARCNQIVAEKISVAEEIDGVSPLDLLTEETPGPGVEEMGGAYHQIDDLRELHQGLEREKFLLAEKFFGVDSEDGEDPESEEVAHIVLNFMGLGVKGSDYATLDEVADALHGKVYGVRGKPMALNYLKQWVGQKAKYIRDALYAEDMSRKDGTPLTRLIKRNFELRAKNRKRHYYAAPRYEVESVKAAPKSTEGKARWDALIISTLSKNKVKPADIPKMKELVEKIMGGQIVPSEFSKVVPKRYVNAISKTLDEHKIKIKQMNLAKEEPEEVSFKRVIVDDARRKRAEAASTAKSFGEPIAIVDNYKIYPL